MAKFQFGVTVPLPPGSVESAALGATGLLPFTGKDVNKVVKLAAGSTDNNYVLAVDADDIEGVVVAMEPATVNNGFGLGSVQKWGLFDALVMAASTTLVVGDRVCAGTQVALGTVQSYPIVRKVAGAEGALFKYRVKSLLAGNGAAGTVVLIERI